MIGLFCVRTTSNDLVIGRSMRDRRGSVLSALPSVLPLAQAPDEFLGS
jgi:hypothetical protein